MQFRKGKEEGGGEEKRKAFTCIIKVKLLYKNWKIQKKQERGKEGEKGKKGGKEGGREKNAATPMSPLPRGNPL